MFHRPGAFNIQKFLELNARKLATGTARTLIYYLIQVIFKFLSISLYQSFQIKLVSSVKYREILYIKLFPIPKLLNQASQLRIVQGFLPYQAISLYQSSQIKLVSSAIYREFLYIKLFPYTKVPESSQLAPQRIGNSFISSYFPIPKYQKQVRLRRKLKTLCFKQYLA